MTKRTGKSLIIVESPAKIKTLRKFLGDNFLFASSVGHIRDLPSKEFGIDIENDFEPKYTAMDEKEDVIKKLRAEAKKVDTVYLSPDPDREGEAIAWHIQHILPENTNIERVTFNSITKDAVLEALKNPREIDQALVDAQQTRRLLDRMVGYKISPLLNRRMQRGRSGSVSAGRVQSVALKMVVEREKEIEAFVPVEYWNLASQLKTEQDPRSFIASLHSVDGKKVEKEAIEGKQVFLISDKKTADSIVSRLKNGTYTVKRVEKKEKKRNPVAPFITSTLQQEASRHHGFSSTRTMSIAQGLYEGIDLQEEGTEGLITYMRTDSVRIAPEALHEARSYIQGRYGKEFLPAKPRQYSAKKAAQDAHEAIRPTNLSHPPEKVEKFLTRDQFLLYSLIWKRFIASQMCPAIYDTVSADIETDTDLLLRATGSQIKFQGFLTVYQEREDEKETSDEDRILPELIEGTTVNLLDVKSDQAFTKPPPRFSEASLVKELEKCGIGRPSTYAAIMNKIQSRDYTTKEARRLKPTELGRIITDMLEANFTDILAIDFTAKMEDSLEEVAQNKLEWKNVLRSFWKQFAPTLEHAEEHLFPPRVPTDLDCPECGKKLQKVWFRDRYFYGCSAYPDCRYTAPIEAFHFSKEDYAEDFDWDQPCPLCGEGMTPRHGRFGTFLGCTQYPECKGIVNIPAKGEKVIPQEDLPPCPAIGCTGKIVSRKSRFGKTFFSCSAYPDCDVIANSIEQLGEKYVDHPKTPYVKKTKKGKKGKTTKKAGAKKKSAPKKPRVMPVKKLSDELAKICGVKELPRPEVVKKIWDYIKANNLQNPDDKRIILPDDTLGIVFGSKEPIHMTKILGAISKHLS